MDLDSAISLFTAFLYLFLAVFLLNYPKGNRLSNRILSLFFLTNFLYAGFYVLIHLGIRFLYYPLYLTSNSLFYFMGPLLLLYTQSICFKDFRITLNSFLHALPYISILAAAYAYYHLWLVPSRTSPGSSLDVRYATIIFFCLIIGALLAYGHRSLKVLANYRRELKNQYSNIANIKLSWLTAIVWAYISIWVVDLFIYLIILIPPHNFRFIAQLNFASGILHFTFAVVIIYRGLNQSNVFAGIATPKPMIAGLSADEASGYRERITAIMLGQKPYLNPELSIDNLAESLSVHSRLLSQVINLLFRKNFCDFVSDYRIEEAKRILADPEFADRTILNILFDAGFNSKSSFNQLFKKKTGLTPSEFRSRAKDALPLS